jgi:hypothetical protein
MDELERASCSDSCPGVFANLKEVYLFGCESLNPDSSKYASAYGESGRDRMRRLFAGCPPSTDSPEPRRWARPRRCFSTATSIRAAQRDRHRAPSSRLLSTFSRNNMVSIRGWRAGDPRLAYRRQVCEF